MESKSRKRIFLAIGSSVVIAWLVFSLSAMGDVFGRSTASVSNTSWLSFDAGKIVFYADSGQWNTAEDTRYFSFEEKSGVITATFADAGKSYFVRESKKELISSDGRSIWYLYVNKAPTIE